MPLPIKPVHQLEAHDEIFGTKTDETEGLSSLQTMFLDTASNREASKIKYNENTLTMLENIYESKDDIINAANDCITQTREATVCRVPNRISDNELLGLKTQGLVVGSGRAVTLTEKGRIALRDKWLVESNSLRANRTKEKFDIRSSEVNGKFKRV